MQVKTENEKLRQAAEKAAKDIQAHRPTLLIGFSGNIAYGLEPPRSRITIRSVCRAMPTDRHDRKWSGLRRVDAELCGLEGTLQRALNCDPAALELFGLKQEHILYCSDEGHLLLDNAGCFLSRRAAVSFGDAAKEILRRLQKQVSGGKANARNTAEDMMNLIRLYAMGIDLLTCHQIVAARDDQHELLTDILEGRYFDRSRKTPSQEYERILERYMSGFRMAAAKTLLPEEPDWERVNALLREIN